MFKRYWNYFKTMIEHKLNVGHYGFLLGLPIWVILFHDWDKFLPGTFVAYARTFRNPDGTKRDGRTEDETKDFKHAWLQHIHLNKHHWQHYVLHNDDGTTDLLPMPDLYIREMVADWAGASKTYGGNLKEWYEKTKPHRMLESNTRLLVEYYLNMVDTGIYIDFWF